MDVSNINSLNQLLAQNAYNKVSNSEPVGQSEDLSGVTFHKMADASFNAFAKMSPDEILNCVRNTSHNGIASSAPAHTNNVSHPESSRSFISEVANELRHKVGKQEEVTQKSLVGDASIVELASAINNANNTVKTMTNLRTKILESFNQVMNMQV